MYEISAYVFTRAMNETLSSDEGATLNLNPEIVCGFVEKAREFHAQEGVVIPEVTGSPTDDWALQVLANHSDDPTYLELKYTIDSLEPDQQITMVALMWLGREDYSLDEWEEALSEAGASWNTRTAEYLIATPLVADYLEEGLAQFGHSCEE